MNNTETKVILRQAQDNPEQGRRVALFDLDGTLVDAHLWLGMVRHHLKTKENLFEVFWYLTSHVALAPFWKMRLISTEKYYQSWGKDLAKLTKGIKLERGKEIFDCLANEYLLPKLKKDVLKRLKAHQADGFLTILTSGSFQDLLQIIAKHLNIDFALGTELEIVKNRFSGKVIPPLCLSKGKAEKLQSFLSEKNLKINFKESFAYSDSVFDLPMLELVGNPVVVGPDKKLLEIAKRKRWQII